MTRLIEMVALRPICVAAERVPTGSRFMVEASVALDLLLVGRAVCADEADAQNLRAVRHGEHPVRPRHDLVT